MKIGDRVRVVGRYYHRRDSCGIELNDVVTVAEMNEDNAGVLECGCGPGVFRTRWGAPPEVYEPVCQSTRVFISRRERD